MGVPPGDHALGWGGVTENCIIGVTGPAFTLGAGPLGTQAALGCAQEIPRLDSVGMGWGGGGVSTSSTLSLGGERVGLAFQVPLPTLSQSQEAGEGRQRPETGAFLEFQACLLPIQAPICLEVKSCASLGSRLLVSPTPRVGAGGGRGEVIPKLPGGTCPARPSQTTHQPLLGYRDVLLPGLSSAGDGGRGLCPRARGLRKRPQKMISRNLGTKISLFLKEVYMGHHIEMFNVNIFLKSSILS